MSKIQHIKKQLMQKKYFIFGLLLFALACDTKNTAPVFISSNGRINHLLLVVEDQQWKSKIGDKLKEIVGAPVLGMPQEEAQFDVTQVPISAFGKMFKATRNVLHVALGEENSFTSNKNRYAKPQQIVKVTGTTEQAILEILEEYRSELTRIFKNADLADIQKKHLKKSHPKGDFQTLNALGLEMNIPTFFKTVDDTGDFLWLRQHLSGGLAQGDSNSNILIYTAPMPTSNKKLVSYISQMRDSIGRKHLPGRKEDMYMITEKAFRPRVFQTKIKGRRTYQTHGKWELLNDFMAGPFLNFAIEDPDNKRWIVLEAFVYAPSVDKRDFMFEVEAVLKTVQFK